MTETAPGTEAGARASQAATGTTGKEPYPGAQRPDDRSRPPAEQGAGAWVKANLFNNALNTVITVVLAVVIVFAVFQVVRWVFTVAEWEVVRRNLTLFMMGLFDRDEQWRLVASVLLVATGRPWPRACWPPVRADGPRRRASSPTPSRRWRWSSGSGLPSPSW